MAVTQVSTMDWTESRYTANRKVETYSSVLAQTAEMVAATTGKKIIVDKVMVNCAASNNVTIESNDGAATKVVLPKTFIGANAGYGPATGPFPGLVAGNLRLVTSTTGETHVYLQWHL